MVLSACSDYFQALFAANPCQVSQAKPKPLTPPNRPTPQHPIVILKDVAFEDLQTVVKFMYHGIVNVSSDKLPAVLKVILKKEPLSQNIFPQTADALQIKGLEKNNELMAPYLAGR